DPGHGQHDWTGWVSAGYVMAAGSGSQLEFQTDWSDLSITHQPVDVAFASRGWDGQSDAADVTATSARPYVLVRQNTTAPGVVQGTLSDLARFTLHAVDGDLSVTGFNVTFQGTFGPASISTVDLVDEAGNILSSRPAARIVHFPLSSLTVPNNASRTLTVRPHVGTVDGATIGAFLENIDDVSVASGGVAFVAPVRTPAFLAYIGSIPAAPVVDAAFAEWSNTSSDPLGDVQPLWDKDVDLSGYAFKGYAGEAYFMAEVAGTALNGTMVPSMNPAYLPPANGTGNGTVGPPPPPENGTDSARFYLDVDGLSGTGFAIGGLGADYLVEVTGKEGLVLSSVASRFNGAASWDWNWATIGNVPSGKDLSHLEVGVPGVSITNVSRAYFEVSGWGKTHDDSSSWRAPSTVFAAYSAYTLATSAYVGGSRPPLAGQVTAQDIAGNQKWFFTNGATNGTGCTSNLAASTTAGASATLTDLTGTNSICWFTPVGQPSATIAGTWEFYADVSNKSDAAKIENVNGDGAVQQWTTVGPKPCMASKHSKCAEEDPNNGDTNYVTSSSASVLDELFTIPNWNNPPSPLSIINITVEASCKFPASSGDLRLLVRVGSTNYASGSVPACPSASYGIARYAWFKNPSNNSAWFASDVGNLQIGVRDNDATTSEVRVSNIRAVVYAKPIYSVAIDKCLDSACTNTSVLLATTNKNTFGDDVLQTASVAAQTLSSGERIRFRVALVFGGTLTVSSNGANPGTSDSRATISIPEFHDVALPIASTLLTMAMVRRIRGGRTHRRKSSSGSAGSP
ncbi:MAG: hypothetical protein AABX97_07130, partial [Candidatus Thermoplasmatota archaeon]